MRHVPKTQEGFFVSVTLFLHYHLFTSIDRPSHLSIHPSHRARSSISSLLELFACHSAAELGRQKRLPATFVELSGIFVEDLTFLEWPPAKSRNLEPAVLTFCGLSRQIVFDRWQTNSLGKCCKTAKPHKTL